MGSPSADDTGKSRKARGQVERYWLCERCAERVILRFDREQGMVTVSSTGVSGRAMATAIPQSTPKVSAGIARVLVRVSALGWIEHPEPNGPMRVRRFLNVA